MNSTSSRICRPLYLYQHIAFAYITYNALILFMKLLYHISSLIAQLEWADTMMWVSFHLFIQAMHAML